MGNANRSLRAFLFGGNKMPVFCPNCDVCDCSYSSPTEYDPEIVLECNNCGNTWYEPNELYIKAQQRDLENDYYDRF